jgi:RNA polymerase sigma-70 factor (ECF subfamily)
MLSSPDSNAENQMAMHQSIFALHSAIARLPEEMREIIELRHFQDLSYEEIGTVLSLPQGTVMSRLYRARKALREELKQQGESILTGGQDA